MPFVESFEEFKTRQHCQCLRLDNGSYLFENGAAYIIQFGNGDPRLASFVEPPTDRFALLRAKRGYLQARETQEAKAYWAALGNCKDMANNAAKYQNCPPPSQRAVDELKAGWEQLEKLRAEIETINAELAQSPEKVVQRQRAEQEAKDAVERTRVRNQVLGISMQTPPPKTPLLY